MVSQSYQAATSRAGAADWVRESGWLQTSRLPVSGRAGRAAKESERGEPVLAIRAPGTRRCIGPSQPGPQLRIMSGSLEPKSLRRPARMPAATNVRSAASMASAMGLGIAGVSRAEEKTPSGMIASRAPPFRADAIPTRSIVPTSCPTTRTGCGEPDISIARRKVVRALWIARGVMTKPTGRWTLSIWSSGWATPV